MPNYEKFKVFTIVISCVLSVFALYFNCETNRRLDDQLQPSIRIYNKIDSPNNVNTESIFIENQRESFISYKSYIHPIFMVATNESNKSVLINMPTYYVDGILTYASKGLIETYVKEGNFSKFSSLSENLTAIAKSDGYSIYIVKYLYLQVIYVDTNSISHDKYYEIIGNSIYEIDYNRFSSVNNSATKSCTSLGLVSVNCYDIWNTDSSKLWNWCKKYL